MEQIVEEWRDVVGWEDRYAVSNFGNIKSKSYLKIGSNVYGSFSFMTRPRDLKLFTNDDGYLCVDLTRPELREKGLVHRLVAKAFISNPDNLPVINHLDSNRKNNFVTNLEWATHQRNTQHSFDSGMSSNKGSLHPRHILTEDVVKEIRLQNRNGKPVMQIAIDLQMRYDTVWKAIKRKNWRHVL